MSKRIDLLNGNIASSLTKLALPIMATSLIQMAYNLTDMIWIGRLGSNQVAAVGAAGMYLWLSSALAILAKMGGQVKVAQSIGASKNDRAVAYAQNSIQLGIIFGLVYGLFMVIFQKPLIAFFNLNSQSVIDDAVSYLIIVGGLVVFTFINQILTGLITATGNSKIPFFATTVGLVINILLDPLLIFGFGPIKPLGVVGSAWATVIAQALVSALFIVYMKKDTLIFMHVKFLQKMNGRDILDIVKIGLPTAVQSATFTLISMVIARLVAGWGDAAVAVQKVGSQIESISWMTAEGFSAAINSFIAQNFGAGNEKRATKGYKVSLVITAIWGLLSTFLLIVFAKQIFGIFIPDVDIMPMGVDYLVILGYSQLFMCLEIVTNGAFAGFGHSLEPSITSVSFTAIRIPLAIFLSSTILGLNGIWWSIAISSVLKGVAVLLWFNLFLHFRARKNKPVLSR